MLCLGGETLGLPVLDDTQMPSTGSCPTARHLKLHYDTDIHINQWKRLHFSSGRLRA